MLLFDWNIIKINSLNGFYDDIYIKISFNE